MEFILHAQKILLLRNSPYFAIAFLAYSFMSSWHCAVMCGGIASEDSKTDFHKLLLWRLLSYSSVGAILGGAGEWILNSPEFQLFNGLAFAILFFVCLAFVFPRVLSPISSHIKRLGQTQAFRSRPGLKGILLSGMPCHLLFSAYAAAALSGSAALGAMILFSHAVITSPSLALAWKASHQFCLHWQGAKQAVRYLAVLITFVNLFYFGSRLFGASEDIEKLILFCF